MSSTLRMPPPTVSGMNTCSAICSTMCTMVSRPSGLAVMSRKHHFVGALFVVAARDFHRIAGVADVDEIHAFDHAAVVHVQAGNDAFGETHID